MMTKLGDGYTDCLSWYARQKATNYEGANQGANRFRVITSEVCTLRFLAAAEIRLKNDVASFRDRIEQAVKLELVLFDGYDRGLGVDASFVTMLRFHWGLDALAAGNLQLSRDFFTVIGGRVKEERRQDLKFISSIGYAVKELVLHGACSPARMTALKTHCSKPSIVGYARLIEGISMRDATLADQGIRDLLKSHPMLIRPGGLFGVTPDEILCFWAIGLVNLATFIGFRIDVPDSELIPRSLLVQP